MPVPDNLQQFWKIIALEYSALKLIRDQSWSLAISSLKKILQVNRYYANAHYLSAFCYHQMGQEDARACKYLSKAL